MGLYNPGNHTTQFDPSFPVLANYQAGMAYKSRKSAPKVMSNAESATHGYRLSWRKVHCDAAEYDAQLATAHSLPNQAPAKDSYTPFAQLGSLAFFRRMVSEPSGFVFC